MARSTRLSTVLILILAVPILAPAASVAAAETGMLYVKSNPPGATAVIEGTVRGKTPVLVRDLPAGEVTVELRIPGVEPVTKQATVEANKVATIDVAIEVPGASLTIVSEPLEATVVLDGREVGKTPLTLEHLDPGEHSLLLLKAGHPRTARSVVLAPGGERVLEVKLGTAGEDDTERPAAGEAAAKPKQAARVPVEVQLILRMLKEAVDKGNHSETRRSLALALKQPDMAEFKEELRAAIGVVQALETREDAIRDGADALVGKEVVLRTRTGTRKGKVESVSVDGITMVRKIIIDGRAVGETRATIKWPALAPEEQRRLAASWKPEGSDGAAARAVLAFARKDEAAVARGLAAAGGHPLGKYLGVGSAAAGPDEDDPKKIWARIEKKYGARRVTATEEVALDREIRAFKARYDKAELDSALRRRMSLAATRAKRASGLVAHWTFDEGGGSVVRDSSGRGKHGRIRGARWVKGRVGGALALDGINDTVDVPHTPALNACPLTVSAWVNTTQNTPAAAGIVNKYVASSRNGWMIHVMGGEARALYFRSSRDSVYHANAGPISDGVWHHVAFTVEGTGGKLYVDGALKASLGWAGTPGASTTAQNVSLGCYPGDANYQGLIDDVRIYARALSAEEVKALATQTR